MLRTTNADQSGAITATTNQTEINLNENQKIALEKLKSHGLIEAHFKSCDWFTTRTHVYALGYLMIAKHYPVSNAMKELEGLNSDQLQGLISGIAKKDLPGLSKHQLNAFLHLSSWGLTSNHLRNKEWFNDEIHFNVLSMLMIEDFCKPDKALEEMADLNTEQLATLLHRDLTINDLRGLSKWELSALCTLKTQGLTHDQIKNRIWFNSQSHVDALCALVLNQELLPDIALTQIENLNESQLALIIKGYNRTDIFSLTPAQLNLFIIEDNRIFISGLKPLHLANKPWFNSSEHLNALNFLLNADHLGIDTCIQELEELSEQQASLIPLGLKHDEVIDLNEFHISAWKQLHNYNLNISHLRGKDWFNSDSHVKTLSELIKSPPYLTPDDAMKMLENADEKRANEIFKKHEEFPYDSPAEQFAVIYFTKNLIDILSQASDSEFSDSKQLLTNELNSLLKSLELSRVPKDMRKEIASTIIEEIQKNMALSIEHKKIILMSASEHAFCGHLNSLSYTVNSLSKFSAFTKKLSWNTNTQKILIDAAKALDKLMPDNHANSDDDGLNSMPGSI